MSVNEVPQNLEIDYESKENCGLVAIMHPDGHVIFGNCDDNPMNEIDVARLGAAMNKKHLVLNISSYQIVSEF